MQNLLDKQPMGRGLSVNEICDQVSYFEPLQVLQQCRLDAYYISYCLAVQMRDVHCAIEYQC